MGKPAVEACAPGFGQEPWPAESATQRFTRHLWTLDLAPTGQRKAQRGYAEATTCACGHERPDRTHVLLDCERTKVDTQPIKAAIARSFAALAATVPTQQERQTFDEVEREVLAWLTGGKREVLEDFLCGFWSARVSE